MHMYFCISSIFIFQRGELFKAILFFANNEAILEKTINKSHIDWTTYLCVGNSSQHFSSS